MNKQEIEKAIAYWKKFKSEISGLKVTRQFPDLDLDEQEKFTDLAISSLEKQIPKVAGCDMCDDTSNWRYFNNKGYKGCPYCLQAIDWSVEDE